MGDEARRGVGCGEEVSLSPPEEGSGEGVRPPPQKIFISNWTLLVHFEFLFKTVYELLFVHKITYS